VRCAVDGGAVESMLAQLENSMVEAASNHLRTLSEIEVMAAAGAEGQDKAHHLARVQKLRDANLRLVSALDAHIQ
jgi:hypothetical protein